MRRKSPLRFSTHILVPLFPSNKIVHHSPFIERTRIYQLTSSLRVGDETPIPTSHDMIAPPAGHAVHP